MWFEKLTGFKEENPEQVRKLLTIENGYLLSKVNGKKYFYGKLEILSLEELKALATPVIYRDKIVISEVVGNVQALHLDLKNNGAFFQAASQFNLLEMISPTITPEMGVGIYEKDFTQGPACAIACGAGTIYRNYLVEIGNQIGQTRFQQIDCLEEIGRELKNEELNLWTMKNGYAILNEDGLIYISKHIKNLSPSAYIALKNKLKIGLQLDTQVTISENAQFVSQAYCSALPIAYSLIDQEYWETFACLILEASYEATFYAALLNYEKTGNNRLYLSLVGGGAFGNEESWILDSIKLAIEKFINTPLDVRIVSYGSSKHRVRELVEYFK